MIDSRRSGLSLADQPARYEDLVAWWAHMRGTAPIHYDRTLGYWHVFRYDAVSAVLNDHGVFSSDMRELTPQPKEFAKVAKGAFLGFDPPQHKRLRSLVSKAFTARMIAELEPRISEIAHNLLDAVQGAEQIELIDRFAYPLPLAVIVDILEIPSVDRSRFRKWSDALFFQGRTDQPVIVATPEMLRSIDPTIGEMNAYFLDIIRRRRERPGTDLVSRLATLISDGERLTDEEILGVCGFLLVAGHITTTMLLSSAVLLLAEHRDQAAELRADPDAVPASIEEVLRYRGQLPAAPRRTTRPTTLCGVKIPADQIVLAWLASANLDETAFPRADGFDIHRSPNRHLALGRGIHYCLGAPLARLELRVAMEALLRRWSDFTVLDGVKLEDPRHTIGAKELPLRVRWAHR
ncbi:cytochrome P450 [Nocardiopsis sediminis]|uniref:Cytochrome P450 n=1 Tax=Nocardiopsis sediminis TaxID=1778267 RepID=A0ABV8FJJ3_9ACTN